MANAWMTGTGRLHPKSPGGPLRGGAPRAVWLTTESNPGTLSARAAAQRLDEEARATHLVWNPVTGEIVQLLPATAAAAGRLTAEGPDRSREGRVCVTIAVIGFSPLPFTDGPLIGLEPILAWLDSWQVPRTWPAGPPPANPGDHAHQGTERLWARGGHFGHSQVPGSQTWGPGAVDPDRVLRTGLHEQRPKPRPAPSEAPRRSALLPMIRTENGVRPHAAASPA